MTTAAEPTGTLDDADRYRPAETVLQAERDTVGIALASNNLTDAAAEHVTPADFWDPELAVVFQACCELSGSGSTVTPLTVRHHLLKTGQLSMLRRTGPTLIATLHSLAPLANPGVVATTARIVAGDAHRRGLHTVFARGAHQTADPAFERADTDALIEAVTRAALAGREAGPEALYVRDRLPGYLETLEQTDGDHGLITTPWRDLNAAMGFRGGQLVVVGARPGSGKSLFALNLAAHRAVRHGEHVLLASLEMSGTEVMNRLLASEGRIPLHRVDRHELTDRDWTAVRDTLPKLQDLNLLIDTPATLTLPHLRARLKWMKTQGPVRLVVVDYLQLMTATTKAERRDLDVAEFTRSLKLLAGEMDVCIVALSQLNREAEKRADKEPQMSDLRESGAIEQDANAVILLHRPDQGNAESPRAGELDVIVPKQRNGVAGFRTTLAWQPHYARIWDMTNGSNEWEAI